MKTPLALLNLLHNKVRTVVAVCRRDFCRRADLYATGLSRSSAYERHNHAMIFLICDVCIRSTDYLYLADSRSFDRDRLYQAEGIAGCRKGDAIPLGPVFVAAAAEGVSSGRF